MWKVLIQSCALNSDMTTLLSLKRFIFVIEGLAIDEDKNKGGVAHKYLTN